MRMHGSSKAVAAVAVALSLLAPATASGDVYDDNPAAAVRGPGDVWLFARGADGSVLARHGDGGTWGDWGSIGGQATSGPAATVYNGTVQVFVRGNDGAIWVNGLTGSTWSGWSSLGGNATSAPAATVRRGPLNYLDLTYRGIDNTIWFESYVPGAGWSGLASIGGNLTSAPAIASIADGYEHVYARGTDLAVYERYWNGSAWDQWNTFYGGIAGAPAAISRSPYLLNLYVRGAGNQSFSDSWNGSSWSGWQVLDPTPVDSTPVPFSDDPGHEAVVARRGANLLLKTWTSSAGWGSWTDLGPIAVPPAPAPPPPPPPPDGEVNLEAGVRCTPPGGRARVSVSIRKKKGAAKPRVQEVVFFTKGKGRKIRIDRKAPFVVRIQVNRPAGTTGRVYARVHFRRSKHGPLHHKTVSRRYSVCR
jgi:hypothetical protein